MRNDLARATGVKSKRNTLRGHGFHDADPKMLRLLWPSIEISFQASSMPVYGCITVKAKKLFRRRINVKYYGKSLRHLAEVVEMVNILRCRHRRTSKMQF